MSSRGRGGRSSGGGRGGHSGSGGRNGSGCGGHSGSGRSGSGRGLGLIEPAPPSIDQQSTPSDECDHDEDTPGLSGQVSQTGSTSSVGTMYIYCRNSGE